MQKPTSDSGPPAPVYLGSGEQVSAKLWDRGPLQAEGDFTLDSRADLNTVDRTPVALFDLYSSSGGLKGPNLEVYYSESNGDGPGRLTPSLTSVAGRTINWDTNAFKALMLYAHGSKAMRYMNSLYPNLSFDVRGRSMLPLQAFAAIDDNPLLTRYRINRSGRPGNIMFYQYEDEPTVRYNPVDESDTIFHEFGHALQHILNPNVLESGGNYDMDMLLEGLADYFAAAALEDDRILEYLGTNSPLLFSPNNRTGNRHIRRIGGDLRFPESYVGDFHLDARIVSNAINDIRKYLQGEPVQLLQNCGSSCSVEWTTAATTLSQSQAFNTANILAHEALRDLVPLSTIVHFAERLKAQVNNRAWNTQCGSSGACKNQLVTAVTSILQSRGILPTRSVRCNASGDCNPFVITGSSPELSVNHEGNLYFAPLTHTGRANEGAIVDQCEAVLLIPNIKVNSGGSAYETLFELYELDEYGSTGNVLPNATQVTGFSSLAGIDQRSEKPPFYDTTQLEVKLWGFLQPGEGITSLAANPSSRFYASHQQAYLSPPPRLFSPNNPPPVGWAYRTPQNKGELGAIEFAFRTRPFEVRYVEDSVYTDRSLRQKLRVNSGSDVVSFCGM